MDKPRKPVKISIQATITVDPDCWELAYGEYTREDVKRHAQEYLQSMITDEGQVIAAVVKGA
jgi:hypothetical protein